MRKSKLTVAVTVYNKEKYVKQCISSIQNQSLQEINIIIVDDGSTDNSFQICKELTEKDDRITLYNQINRGTIVARRKACELCNTEYITFVDADDFVNKTSYKLALSYMDKGIDMVMFDISRYHGNGSTKIDSCGPEAGYYDNDKIKELYDSFIWDCDKNRFGIDPSLCTKIIKRDILKKSYDQIGNSSIWYGEDCVAFCWSFLQINSLQVVHKSYYMHRAKENNVLPEYISSDEYFKYLVQLSELMKRATSHLDEKHQAKKQIDYFVIYSVNLKRKLYEKKYTSNHYLFPFNQVEKNDRVIIYGAGGVGHQYYEQIQKTGFCKLVLWVDRNASNICDEKIDNIDRIFSTKFDKLLIAIDNPTIVSEVVSFLIKNDISENKIVKGVITI